MNMRKKEDENIPKSESNQEIVDSSIISELENFSHMIASLSSSPAHIKKLIIKESLNCVTIALSQIKSHHINLQSKLHGQFLNGVEGIVTDYNKMLNLIDDEKKVKQSGKLLLIEIKYIPKPIVLNSISNYPFANKKLIRKIISKLD